MQSTPCRVFTCACCLAVLWVLPDRAVAQQTTTLTAMDYVEIQQLVIDQDDGKTRVRRTRNVKTPEGWRFRSRRHDVNPSPGG